MSFAGQYVAPPSRTLRERQRRDAVVVTYAKEKPNVEFKLTADNDPAVVETSYGPEKRVQSERGNAAAAFASAPVKLDQTYVTPSETHVPIELQGTTAMWDGDYLTIYEESQGIFNMRSVLAQMFGLPKENVRVLPSSLARVSAANFGPGHIVRWRWRRREIRLRLSSCLAER
jgi:xanthine dehydrogenase YagR molybdenum-binding subunit